MTLPAHKIAEYVHPSVITISVRDASGAPCFQADRTQIEALIAANTVVGVARGKRLRYIQLLVPPDVAFRALGEWRHTPGKLERWRVAYQEDLGRAKITVLKKLHKPTGALVYWSAGEGFRWNRFNPDAWSGVRRHGPLRPPFATDGQERGR